MGVPVVLLTSPANGETGVYKNKILTITFSEAIAPATVKPATVYLQNLDTNARESASLSLAGAVLTITPVSHLFPNTGYRLVVIGEDMALSSGAIESLSTADELVATQVINFNTGNEIEATELEKTEEEQASEGELDLPSSVQVVPDTSYLTILGSVPENGEFGVDPETFSEIRVEFSEPLESSSLDDETFQVLMSAYYEEDDGLLAYPNDDQAKCNFQFQEPNDTSGEPYDFSPITGTLSISGNEVVWTMDPARKLPHNARVRVIMKSVLMGVSGETLDGDYMINFYSQSCPYVMSIEKVRDEFFPHILSTMTDAVIGKTAYKNAMNMMDEMRWGLNPAKLNQAFREYVLHATIFDIFNLLRIEEDMQAGQFKRLGDMAVRFDSDIGKTMPAKQADAKKQADLLKATLTRAYRGVMQAFVKGRWHPEQKLVWRTRTWRNDMIVACQGEPPGTEVAGNTRSVRATKIPGQLNRWQ